MGALMKIPRLAAVMVIALAVTPAGLSAAWAERLVIGMTQFPSNFHPEIEAMLAKTMVLSAIRRPFIAHDQDWQPRCMLCTTFPTLENGLAKRETLAGGGEGLAVTYEIHPEATWGDGKPVTADDVVFTWEMGRHPLSGVSDQEAYRRILSIEVLGDKTFTIHLDRVTFDYYRYVPNPLPAHLDRAIFEAAPGEYRNRTAYDSDTTNPALAFGPYRIARVESGAEVVLVPNETWWGSPPAFEEVVFRIIENTAALEANLLSGAIDMIAGELGLTLDQALAFEKRHGEDYDLIYKAGLIYEHIDLNLDNPLLAEPRMRRALLHAIDREAISERLFQGRQPPAHSSVSPLDWVHSDLTPQHAYDPARAAALLDELGWVTLKKGVRHNAAGEPLVFEIMTTAGSRTRELVEQVLQSQWKQVGIDVRIRNEPARVFFGQTVSQRRFSAMAMFAWVSSPENVPRTTLRSDQVPSAENNWSGQNYTGYSNPEMDRLLDAIEVELDRDKRAALWARFQKLYAEDLPVLPLYWRAEPYILPKWLKGLRPTGHTAVTTLWIEEWRSEGR
jgi:peptide/nickel transport system substrate-binding protein